MTTDHTNPTHYTGLAIEPIEYILGVSSTTARTATIARSLILRR